MSRYIDAEQLEKNGWFLQRNVAYTENYGYTETLKPTDYPAAETKTVRYWHEDLQRAGRPHKVIEVE